jgi:hypothetical protein
MEDIKVFDPIVQVAIVVVIGLVLCVWVLATYKLFLIKVK